jgi:hypothetical protein
MEGITPGNTPFELAVIGRKKAHLTIVTHLAVKELVDSINECERMIAEWRREQLHFGINREETLQLATQALKDKKLFEAALVEVTKTAGKDLGLEA